VDDLRERLRAEEGHLLAAQKDAAAAADEVRSAEVQLEYTVVKAPFAGVVRGKPLDVGELLGTFNEKPAVELFDPETLLAEIDVPEKRLEKIRPGGPAEVVLEAYPETRLRAEVVEVGSGVDRSKGTVIAKLKLLDRPERLLPDMRARANFLTEALDATAAKAPPKVVVPRSAVAERGGGKVVFRIEDGRARMVSVALGPEVGRGFELRSGPGPGTVLIANPPDTLADGQPVKERSK
jgi:RND family efflux transporter MFP subunit